VGRANAARRAHAWWLQYVYGQAPAQETNIAVNKMTVVPLERLSDEELAYYLALAEKGRALAPDIDSPRPAPGRLQAGAEG
jgi:hypothetical protein